MTERLRCRRGRRLLRHCVALRLARYCPMRDAPHLAHHNRRDAALFCHFSRAAFTDANDACELADRIRDRRSHSFCLSSLCLNGTLFNLQKCVSHFVGNFNWTDGCCRLPPCGSELSFGYRERTCQQGIACAPFTANKPIALTPLRRRETGYSPRQACSPSRTFSVACGGSVLLNSIATERPLPGKPILN